MNQKNFSKIYIVLICIVSSIACYYALVHEPKIDFKDNIVVLNTYNNSVCGACVKSINSAKNRVLLATYGFSDSHIARSIVLANTRGIKVKLYSGVNLSNFFKHYIGDSAEVFIVKIKSGGLYHQKILIADDWVGILSANFTNNSLHIDFNDCIFLKSKKIADALEKYLIMINDEALSTEQEVSDYIYVDNKEVFCKMLMLPHDKSHVFSSLEASVERSKYIHGVFFVMSNKQWYDSLLLHKPHRVVANKNPNNIKSSNILSLAIKGKNIHSKMLFSKSFLMTGSMNFSKNAVSRNYESIIFISPNIFYNSCVKYFTIIESFS
ncbi:MAG: hypothetical protein KAH32_03465 [Chlamydiia bacterium]|nr:hypothetical protein [Chlamydiia bacterium]